MSIALRGFAHAEAFKGEATTLSATSRVGDTAVLIMSGQQTSPGDLTVPEGWTGVAQQQIVGITRCGYFARRLITDPAQTQDIQWANKSQFWGARQNAFLMIFDGEADVRPGDPPWAEGVPTIERESYVVSQSHGPSANPLMEWTVLDGDIVFTGKATVSTEKSWSALRVARTSHTPVVGPPGQVPAAWLAFSIVRPVPAPLQNASVYEGGTTKPCILSVWRNRDEVFARRAGVMPSLVRTTAALLAKSGFIVAHRGGSQGWVEGTAQGYTDSVAHGVDALEFSAARTVDGVWFQNHDNNLKSLGGPDRSTSTMTWSEVVDALKGTGKTPCRLDWLLEHYGDGVIVFDPKVSFSRYDEIHDIFKSRRDRTIMKFFGDNKAFFQAMKLRGYSTWGYAYPSSVGSAWWNDFVNGAHIDIPSMSWDASADIWKTLTDTGKPVVSHITSIKAQIDAAAAKGARGSIVSAVSTVLSIQV